MNSIVYHPVLQCLIGVLILVQVDGHKGDICPDGFDYRCRCFFSYNTLIMTAANCTSADGSLSGILDRLPPSLKKLSVTFAVLNETGANFTRFAQLQDLEIVWDGPPDELPRARAIHNFTESTIFRGLGALRVLRINYPTNDMDPMILQPLDNLEFLDFSNMGYMTTAKLAKVFNGSFLQQTPMKLRKVWLNRFSGVNVLQWKNFKLQELFPIFENMYIHELDIKGNGDIYMFPGLIAYLPELQTCRVSGTSVLFDETEPQQAFCLVIEGLLHKKVQHFDLSNINTVAFGFFEDFMAGFMKKYLLHWIFCYYIKKSGSCICETHLQKCGKYLPIDLACNNLPVDINPLDFFDPTCEKGIKIPLPRKMSTLLASNTQFSFRPSLWERVNRCFAENVIKIQDFSYAKFPFFSTGNFTVNGFLALEDFNVENSDWGYAFVNAGFLHTFPSLKKLKIGGTTIGNYIFNDTLNEIFSKSANLLELHLNDANIVHIPYNEFSSLKNLTVLNLSGNGLVNITFDTSSLSSLKHFNISRNKLHNLTKNVIEHLENNSKNQEVYVDLSSNILSCNCESYEFMLWVNKTKVHLVDKSSYLCVSHEGLVFLNTVQDNFDAMKKRCFPPPDYSIYIAIAATTVTTLIITSLGILIYKMRWKIRFGLLWLKYRNELDDRSTYKYDAFVVYSDEDRYWVHQIMLPEFERERQLKLCVHFRDFIPGHNIEEQIVTSINDSRKTIIVLSPSFLDSSWCDFEMQVARNRLYSEGRDIIVPIKLIECPNERLTAPIKNILNSTTYIEWTNDEAQQRFFWDKLALSVCRKVSGGRTSSGDNHVELRNTQPSNLPSL